MQASRDIILSNKEVCEAVKTFIRTKYHEKIEPGYTLANILIDEDNDFAVTFTFVEDLSPFTKSSSHAKK